MIDKGTYKISNPLIIKNSIKLVGYGQSTVLQETTGAGNGGIIYQDATHSVSNSSIENLVLDCNNETNCSGIQIYNFNNLTLRNVQVINVKGVWGAKLGNYATSESSSKSTYLYLHDFTINGVSSTTLEAMIIVNTNFVFITGLAVFNCTLTIASLVSIYYLCRYVNIHGAFIDDENSNFGLLDITGSFGVTVTGCTLLQNG